MRILVIMLKPGDILLTRLRAPYLKTVVRYFTGSYIAHNYVVIDKKDVIEATLLYGIHELKLGELSNEYVHVFRLKDFLRADVKNIIKKMLVYEKKHLGYSVTNLAGHICFDIIKNLEKRFNVHIVRQLRQVDKNAFLYNSEEITCSQLLLKAILETVNQDKKRKLYNLLGNNDIRSFFPTKIPLIADYVYTLFLNPIHCVKLNPNHIKKLDRSNLQNL